MSERVAPEPLDEQAIRERHRTASARMSRKLTGRQEPAVICEECAVLSPCDAIRATDALAAERSLREQLERVASPRPETYACQRCGRRDGLDTVLSDADWAALESPHNLLCLWCIDDLAAAKGLRVFGRVFYGGRPDYEQRGGLMTADYDDVERDLRERAERLNDELESALSQVCEVLGDVTEDNIVHWLDAHREDIRSYWSVLRAKRAVGRADAVLEAVARSGDEQP